MALHVGWMFHSLLSLLVAIVAFLVRPFDVAAGHGR